MLLQIQNRLPRRTLLVMEGKRPLLGTIQQHQLQHRQPRLVLRPKNLPAKQELRFRFRAKYRCPR